jgi:integrase
MAAPMEKTRHPGIYKRGSRYVVTYRSGDGRPRKESAGTLNEAQRLKAARTADVARGEFHEQTRVRFRAYAEEWVERQHGRKGCRESTRDDNRRVLQKYAFPFFDDRLGRSVSQVTPRDVANFIAWLCDEREQGRRLSDGSVRRILAPVRSCLATAVREGLIRHNPAAGASLPHRVGEEAEKEEVRALTREQLSAFLDIVNPQHRTLFELLAETGLRWSEATALRRKDLRLDGSRPVVKVRRALVRGHYGPPKSKHSRRDVPLSAKLVSDLRRRRKGSEWGRDDDFVFPSLEGTPLQHSNLMRRVLRPVAEEVGAP